MTCIRSPRRFVRLFTVTVCTLVFILWSFSPQPLLSTTHTVEPSNILPSSNITSSPPVDVWPQFRDWRSNGWTFQSDRRKNIPFSRSLQTYTASGHDGAALRSLIQQSQKEPLAEITTIVHVTDQSRLQLVDAVLEQTVPSSVIWVVCTSKLHSLVRDKIGVTAHIKIVLVDPLQSMPNKGTVADARWLPILKSVHTPWVWVLDGGSRPGTHYLEYVYRLMQTKQYEDALLGTHATLLPANLNNDNASHILCLPEDFDMLPKLSQPVDMLHGAWLLKRAWLPHLTINVFDDEKALPLPYFISQSLFAHAHIPTIVIPDGQGSDFSLQANHECTKIRTQFSESKGWRQQLGFRMRPAVLDLRQTIVRQRVEHKDTVMFIVDGHEQASALHPLICRFNQTVHVMVTGVNRGLSGTVLEKTFRQTKCGAIVHDMQLQATDDLTMSAAVIDSVSRLMLVLRPRILIYLQDDRPLTRALEVMAHDQQVVAIGLPSKDIRHALWIADLSLDALQYWHKMNIKLVVITDRRPHSLSRLLQSTGRSYYLGDKVDLMVHMEQSADRATRMLINSFQWRHGSKIVRHRIRKGGLMPAIIESWYPDHDDDYAVLLEDDIEVSPLFYAWAKYSVLQYRYSGDAEASRLMYGVSLYSPRNLELWPQGRRPFHPRQALQDYYPSRMPYLSQVPCSWGAVYFPEHWREFHHYLTVRLEDMQQDRLLNITVPDTRSERWKKSWKKYFIQLMYLRSYVMLYPNFQQFESFSTNHLEFGTHVKKERRQKTIGHFQVPLMQRDTILAQLPDHRLPYFNDLPVLDLWGRLVTHTELDRIAAAWHRRVSACERNVGHFDAQDLLCPFPKSDEEREAMSALAMLPSTKKPKEGPKTKEAMQPIAYTTIYLTPPTGKEAALEDEPVLWSQEDDLPQPIDVSRMSGGGQEEVRTFLDEELQDIHQDIDSLNRLFYSVYSAN